ncbi:hypothetical protein H109_01095, partial [Trichophyton interdigitale MR816]
MSTLPVVSTSTSQSKDSNMSNTSLPPAYSAIENTGALERPEGAGIRLLAGLKYSYFYIKSDGSMKFRIRRKG